MKERVRAVANLPGYEVQVISPVPWFPPIRQFKRWYHWSQFPHQEVVSGLPVSRPRYVLPPKVGGYFHPRLMYRAVRKSIDRVREEFDFDLIDAHWVYPYGVLAQMLGQRYGKPVVMTGRGEDMRCFPDYPLIGGKIRQVLSGDSSFVAVSEEIGQLMRAQGAKPEQVSVIPNGVDCQSFAPMDRLEARDRLGLPSDIPFVVSVGERLELKGFHILVEAIALLKDRFPSLEAAIVGRPGRFGRDYTTAIEQEIEKQQLGARVKLVGPRPHEELKLWYNAADVFVLLSSREGSPNVLMEALACGTPAVATGVGGITEVFTEPRMGIVISERTAVAAADGLAVALSRDWDRQLIRQAMESRSWKRTAESVAEVFDRALFTVKTSE